MSLVRLVIIPAQAPQVKLGGSDWVCDPRPLAPHRPVSGLVLATRRATRVDPVIALRVE